MKCCISSTYKIVGLICILGYVEENNECIICQCVYTNSIETEH